MLGVYPVSQWASELYTQGVGWIAQIVGLSAVFMLLTLVIFVVYGLIAAALRGQLLSQPRLLTWLRRGFAGAFVALGARLALADR